MALTFAKLTRAIPATVQPAATAHFKTAASRLFPRLNHFHFHTASKIMGSQGASTYRANGDNGDEGSTDGELNQWKHRAPYKVHDNDPNFHARYTGSCHCGKVTYQLSREKPLDSKYCHCTTCQKIHGAPFQWAAIFHKEDINFTNGIHDLGWYESSEKTTVHKLPCKVSCAYCRTPIMDEGRNMILLFPTLIDFKSPEDRKNFDINCHMFYPRRVVDINDGKPKWTGINDQSELVGDTPEKYKEEHKKRKREDEEKSKQEEKAGNADNHNN